MGEGCYAPARDPGARSAPGFRAAAGSIEVVGRSATEFDAQPIAPVEPSASPPRRSWLARSWMLLVVLAVTAAVSVVVRHVIYPALSWNRDEATYLWQVRGLRAGQLMTTTGGLPQFFQPWLTGVRDGHFFSQYTLGWPGLMFVADLFFGSSAAAIVWGTVLAVLGTYAFTRELTRDHRLALVTAVLMLASPMVITQAGVYLGYLFSLGLGLLFGAALLSGIRRDQRWRFVVAGVFLGVLFITRPFDAVLWAVAMGGYAIFVTWRQWPRQFRVVVLVFLGFLPLLMITLAQNRIVTGSFTQFPFTAKEPLDRFGFGYRAPDAAHRRHSLHVRGGGARAAVSARSPSRSSWSGATSVCWPRRAGSGSGAGIARPGCSSVSSSCSRPGTSCSGATGWPAASPTCRVRCTSSRCSFRCASSSPPACSGCGNDAGAADRAVLRARVATVPFLYDKSAMNHRISVGAGTVAGQATASLHGKSLIIIRDSGPYLLHINPFSQNAPDLDGQLLYAVDRGAASFRLLDRYPDRRAYVERTSNPALDDAIHHTDADAAARLAAPRGGPPG